MEKRKGLRDQFLAKIGKFTEHAQVQCPEKNLTKALVLTKGLQDGQQAIEHSLDQRWWESFSNDDSKSKNSSPSSNHELDQLGGRVMQAWRKFYESLPNEQSANLEAQRPDLRFLQDVVNAANANLKKKQKTQSIRQGFHRVCETFGNYENLSGVIPSGDKYICLITGSLGALIKASVNHTDVAEAISKALVEISEDIGYWGCLIIQHPVNEKMRGYIRELYVVVFECFADIFTEWQRSSWTRIRGSFNCNTLRNIVDRHRAEMKTGTDWLRREAELERSREMRNLSQSAMQISTTFADDRKEVDFIRGMLMHFLDTTVSDPQQRKLLVTGNFMQQTLGENLVKRELDLVDPSSNVKATSPAAPQMAGNVQVSVAGPGDATKTHSTRHLKYIIGALGLSLSTTKPLMPMVSARDLNIQPDIFDALRKWTAIKTSRFLWIEGPADIDRPSQNTMTSASLVGVAQRSNASYVAYFGQPIRAKDTDDRDKGSADGLTSIIHTLISQLVNQLPEEFDSDADFSVTRFSCLVGTKESIDPALSLLQDLLQAFPGPLICFVDSLHFLTFGKKDTTALVRRLVEILCVDHHSADKARKVCFTTDGNLRALNSFRKTVKLDRVTYESEAEDEHFRLKEL